VTLKELSLDNPTGYPNGNPISPCAGVCDPEGAGSGHGYPMMLTLFLPVQVSVTLKELGLNNPTGYSNVNPISQGAGVCNPEGAGSGQLRGPTKC
jgi:hypothetical protein